jgi:ABC-type phosphate/phosphonate transport system permease subunit
MFEILEPQLDRNKAQFAQMKRLQIMCLIAAPTVALVFGFLVWFLSLGPWADLLALAVVAIPLIGIVVFEANKILIFRRDLRQRQENSEPPNS